MAYECLTRGPRGSNFEQAQVLFDYVRLKHDEPAVDRAATPDSCRSCWTPRASGVAPRQLIVEIVEYAPVRNDPVLASVSALRAAGVRIAVDDIGLGHSNLRMILDVHPELFKIACYFGAVTIAEGIEEERDVAPLVDCGLSLIQGYFFGKPVMVEVS
jgi:EAL domain-containing protein (putative c-di-GMP-specific phosphodiesterase class I)